MRIAVENVMAEVIEATPGELEWLIKYIRCKVKKYGKIYQKGEAPETIVSTGWFNMYEASSRKFAAGLVPVVAKGAALEGMQVAVEDDRAVPCTPDWPSVDVRWLRDYQLTAAQRASHGGRGLIKAPCAAGKTEISIALTRALPIEWGFFVHRAELTTQAAKRFEIRTGEQAGYFEAGRWRKGTSNFTVATFQSITSSLRKGDVTTKAFLEELQGVVIDESHAIAAETYYDVLMRMPNAYYRFGQSATPFHRGEKEKLLTLGALGPILYKITMPRLVDVGALSKPTIRMVECYQNCWNGEATFARVYKEGVVESVVRNKQIAEIAKIARPPAMIFVEKKAHGKELTTMINRRGVKAEFAWSGDRYDKLEKLKDGRIDVLVCTPIYQEGVDVPELKSVINAGGYSSAVASVQRMGRGARLAGDDDNTFDVWDLYDRGQHWLEDHAEKRKLALEAEGFPVEVLR